MADKSSNFLVRFIKHHAGWKLLSLLLAIVTWYAIQAVISFEAVVTDIPLNIRVKEGWAILDRSATAVDVRFRGSQDDIRFLSKDQVRVDVNIEGQPFQDSLAVKLLPSNIHAPGAVRPIMIRPDEVVLKLDQEGEKEVPVKVDFQGMPPEGVEVSQSICTPATITLMGPRQRLGEIKAVFTAAIDLEGRSRSFKKMNVPLVAPSETWMAHMKPDNVTVDVTMGEPAASKEVEDLPIQTLVPAGSNPRLNIEPKSVRAEIKGRAELLNTLRPEDVRAYVDCSALQKGSSYDVPVLIQLPLGLNASKIEPPTVKITVVSL